MKKKKYFIGAIKLVFEYGQLNDFIDTKILD